MSEEAVEVARSRVAGDLADLLKLAEDMLDRLERLEARLRLATVTTIAFWSIGILLILAMITNPSFRSAAIWDLTLSKELAWALIGGFALGIGLSAFYSRTMLARRILRDRIAFLQAMDIIWSSSHSFINSELITSLEKAQLQIRAARLSAALLSRPFSLSAGELSSIQSAETGPADDSLGVIGKIAKS